MAGALDLSSDVIAAGAALAGLLLVFMGSVATSYDTYEPTERRAVVARYKKRVWFAFAGFALAIFATFFALIGKWFQVECAATAALGLLFLSLGFVVAAALIAALDVK